MQVVDAPMLEVFGARLDKAGFWGHIVKCRICSYEQSNPARQEKKEKEEHFSLLIAGQKIGLRQRERTKQCFVDILNSHFFDLSFLNHVL